MALVLSLFRVYYILMLYRNAFVVSNNLASLECNILDKERLVQSNLDYPDSSGPQ